MRDFLGTSNFMQISLRPSVNSMRRGEEGEINHKREGRTLSAALIYKMGLVPSGIKHAQERAKTLISGLHFRSLRQGDPSRLKNLLLT